MYALVEISSKQYKVAEGDVILVDLQHKGAGEKLNFDTVMAVVDGDSAVFGTPFVAGAAVEAEVVRERVLDKKVKVYKYNKRKGYRKTQGHREGYSEIKIARIMR